MPKKRRSRNNDEKLRQILAAVDEERRRERDQFKSMVDSLRSASPLKRAEGCLQFWAERLAEWGDHEAVVYLISRGSDSSSAVRSIQANWREAEMTSVERFVGTEIADQSVAKSIRKDPTEFMARFWGFFDRQELSIDATMLRTAHWCRIQGYEQWWRGLDKELRQIAFSGGVNPFMLFNYSRSDYAVKNMSYALQVSLDSIKTLSLPRSTPWWRNDGNLGCATHEAAAFVFSHTRIRPDSESSALVERAADDLRKYFDHTRGAWPAFSGEPNRLSVESTAVALHALAAMSVDDFDQFAEPAEGWLWSQQHSDGYWFESAAPDPVWLTVLVLDAIALVSGGKRLTFSLDVTVSPSPLVFVAYQHDDTKWLEELKKHLGGLVHSGAIEFFDDRQIGAGIVGSRN